jgi:hypothetical protein
LLLRRLQLCGLIILKLLGPRRRTLLLSGLRCGRLRLRHLRSGRLRRAWAAHPRRARRRGDQPVQFLGIEFRMPRHGDPVFVGNDIGSRLLRRALGVGRQRQKCHILVAFAGVDRYHQHSPKWNVFFDERQIPQHHDQYQVHDDRNPDGLAPAGALQVVLQLDQKVRHARIQFAIRLFPVAAVVERQLLGLRGLGRAYRVLEWDLGDRHALILLVDDATVAGR